MSLLCTHRLTDSLGPILHCPAPSVLIESTVEGHQLRTGVFDAGVNGCAKGGGESGAGHLLSRDVYPASSRLADQTWAVVLKTAVWMVRLRQELGGEGQARVTMFSQLF